MQHVKLNPVNARVISKSSVNAPDYGGRTSAINGSAGCKITAGGNGLRYCRTQSNPVSKFGL